MNKEILLKQMIGAYKNGILPEDYAYDLFKQGVTVKDLDSVKDEFLEATKK